MFYHPSNRAFTLIEVVVAVGLVATVMMAVLRVRDDALTRNSDAADKLLAADVADEKLAELASFGFPFSYQTGGKVPFRGGFVWSLSEISKSHPTIGHLRELQIVVERPGADSPSARLSIILPVEI